MTISPRLRKFVLLLHIASSVGWVGAVLAYLVLDITAVTSQDAQLVQGAYLAMGLTIWYAIVPLALASVLIGIINALSTSWGLFRHYWVLTKLLITVFATVILLVEAGMVASMARQAATGADPRMMPGSLPHSIGGLLVLLGVTALSVYKPRGVTRYGWHRQHELRSPAHAETKA